MLFVTMDIITKLHYHGYMKNKQKPKKMGRPIIQENLDRLLEFIIEYIEDNHVPPTQQAMADHFGVARFTIQNRMAHLINQDKLINLGRRGCVPK